MRRLYTLDEFANLTETQQRDSETSISTVSVNQPEFGDSGRLVHYIFSTGDVGRDMHTVAPDAWRTENYSRNPVVLWAHDDSQLPIGRVTDIGDCGGKLRGTIEYADRDLNPFADMVYRMVKARYINAVSTSWMPLEWKRSTDKSRPGGLDFKAVDLLEISNVPIPAMPTALAEARSAGIDTSPMVRWAEQLLDRSDAILIPRDELEELRRAAMMPPSRAAAVLNTHKQRAGIGQADDAGSQEERALKAKHARALARAPKVPTFKRGLYDVAQLCYLLEHLGYCHNSCEYEAELEGDESEVPGMLGEALMALGGALKAMATEEIDELLEDHEGDDEEADVEARALSATERAFVAEGKTPRARAWRRGIAIARAGKSLSASNQEKLEDTQKHHDRAMKHSRALKENHDAVSEHLEKARAAHEGATQTLSELGEHVRAAQAEPEKASEHLTRAMKSHGDMEEEMGAVSYSHNDMEDRHADVEDSHHGMERSVKAAQRAVRGVLTGAVTSEGDESAANSVRNSEAAKEEKARALRAARAAELARQYREPITLD